MEHYEGGNLILNSLISRSADWPKWSLPDKDEIFNLAKLSTKYIRFLNPQIVAIIVEDNNKNKQNWISKLVSNGINADLYLWTNSPCAFPGIRRHSGGKEIASHKGQINLQNHKYKQALMIDDNDFPKEIWSYVFRGKKFSKSGPVGYALAHLVDHKGYKNRMEKEFAFKHGYSLDDPLYGLYTCPSNTIYIPDSIIKPTDVSEELRQLLFRKMFDLYDKYCNILPDYITLPVNNDSIWSIDNFEWSDPVGSIEYVKDFLDYRKKIIDSL